MWEPERALQLVERLTTKDPDVLWALVAIVFLYAIWGVLAGRDKSTSSL